MRHLVFVDPAELDHEVAIINNVMYVQNKAEGASRERGAVLLVGERLRDKFKLFVCDKRLLSGSWFFLLESSMIFR